MSRDPDDEWSPDYDSTWDEEDEAEEAEEMAQGSREPGSRGQPVYRKSWNRAARDLQNYRHGYREDKNYQAYSVQNAHLKPNLEFYQNKKRFEPGGLYVDELLEEWKEDYITLERNHSYIQWLFPLREYGMNSCAKPLTKAEIEAMRKEPGVRRRFLAAYKLMLDFYGITLDEKTGKVSRAENWEERFKNLNYHSHNNLRITRILKCLGELGFDHFQAPLVKFFLEETLCNGKLQSVKRSVLDYFLFTIKNKTERRKLVHFAWENYKPKDNFVWGPVEKLRTYRPPAESGLRTGIGTDETEGNGYVQSCDDGEDDISDGETLVQNVSFQLCKPPQVSIPLTGRRTDQGKENRKDAGSSTQDSDPVSENLSHDMCGMQLHAENRDKNNGEIINQVSPQGSSEQDSEVPSTEGRDEDLAIEGTINDVIVTVSKDPNEPCTFRKRKMTNSPSNDLPDGAVQSKADSEPCPEEEKGQIESDSANKKQKLHEEPYSKSSPTDDQQLPLSEEQEVLPNSGCPELDEGHSSNTE